ncbi:SARP family transcriptional regulator [Longispora fulva]|uniref:DNA-binding SARP family transcriptional activator n=1 Tax=Longispora fulva TaxID=619741 RepID=A0A8J7GMY6_9ACTN|nr:BTAD domain-containing putative transcriptional regulator [Longispora fulva]MBG6134638.1 DNA-binding SARP family transcriptional activator [Longispora fulva]GIG61845.1 SARP family transcriptional regulator [Longispora fulva]
MTASARYTVLGQLRAFDPVRELELGPRRQRSVFAQLLLRANRVVSRDELVDGVWGGQPPPSVTNVVQTYVRRLRGVLEPDRQPREPARILTSVDGGYLLRVGAGQLDLDDFDGDVAAARRLGRLGDRAGAAGTLRTALDRWLGVPLADVTGPFVDVERARLEEHRLAAYEEWAQLEIDLGRHCDLIGELTSAADRHPHRERLLELLMLALYRSGRQTEALAAYRDAHRRTAGLLGLDPGPALQELHRSILAADPALIPTPAALAQLPRPPAGFAGRETELAGLAGAAGPGALTVVTGPAGVGKTALVLHWAHRTAEFPQGRLFADLRGFDPAGPADPGPVLYGFLLALGVPAERIPADPHARSALYRSLLADRRLLVVLDNARDARQVLPLLPGAGGSATVVTSRNRLDALTAREGARPVRLDVLDLADALALLADPVGADRIGAAPVDAHALVELCDRLPLALRIAGSRLAEHPRWPVGAVVDELRCERRRLAALAAEDAGVAATLSLSYRALPAETARLFRLLGLHPGADVDASAAGALLGAAPAAGAAALHVLATAHLVEERSPGRYARHDLVRLYTRQLAATDLTADGRTRATARLLDYYLDTTRRTRAHWRPDQPWPPGLAVEHPPAEPRTFADRAAMMAWFDAEDRTPGALVALAADVGEHARAWWLARELWPFFYGRRNSAEWADTLRTGLAAAGALDDDRGRMAMLGHLGTALNDQRSFEESVDCHRRASALAHRLGDRAAEAGLLLNLGVTYALAGRPHDAARQYQRVVIAARDLGADALAGRALANLAEVALRQDRPRAALTHVADALAAAGEDAVWGQRADLLLYRGQAHRALGEPGPAVEAFRHTLDAARASGQRRTEAEALYELGLLEPAERDRHWRAAQTLAAELGLPLAAELAARLAPDRPRGLFG